MDTSSSAGLGSGRPPEEEVGVIRAELRSFSRSMVIKVWTSFLLATRGMGLDTPGRSRNLRAGHCAFGGHRSPRANGWLD